MQIFHEVEEMHSNCLEGLKETYNVFMVEKVEFNYSNVSILFPSEAGVSRVAVHGAEPVFLLW